MHESVYGSQLLCNCCVLLGNKVGIACVNRHRSVRARLCAVAMCNTIANGLWGEKHFRVQIHSHQTRTPA